MEHRTCKTCGTAKPPAEFYARSDGLPDLHCKDCVRAYERKAGAARRRAAGMKQRWQRTIVSREETLGQVCSRCRAWQPLTKFYGRRDGTHYSICTPCVLVQRQERYEKRRGDRPRRSVGLDLEKVARWKANYVASGRLAEYQARKRAEDPQRFRDYANRRRARELGAPISDLTPADWASILDAFGHRCAYCATDGPLTQDHVTPLTRGGHHTASNVVPACKSCNSRKRTRTPEEWLGRTPWQTPGHPPDSSQPTVDS